MIKEIIIHKYGNIYREHSGGSFAGNVYDVNGICPTINTAGGGNREPIILVEKYERQQRLG